MNENIFILDLYSSPWYYELSAHLLAQNVLMLYSWFNGKNVQINSNGCHLKFEWK